MSFTKAVNIKVNWILSSDSILSVLIVITWHVFFFVGCYYLLNHFWRNVPFWPIWKQESFFFFSACRSKKNIRKNWSKWTSEIIQFLRKIYFLSGGILITVTKVTSRSQRDTYTNTPCIQMTFGSEKCLGFIVFLLVKFLGRVLILCLWFVFFTFVFLF